jgi:hypothetical protein
MGKGCQERLAGKEEAMRTLGLVLLCAGWAGGCGAAAVLAGEPCGEDGQRRAGYPQEVSLLAAPSDTGHYVGYYVGGGAPVFGQPRGCDQGTWGWDYCGLLLPKRVRLRWWDGRCYQGGVGAYRTAGINLDSKSTP